MTFLADNPTDVHHYYLVTVMTGWKANGGTTSNVGMYVVGMLGKSVRHILSDPEIESFQMGAEDSFILAEKYSLGPLKSVCVWHDCSGVSPAWFVLLDTIAMTYVHITRIHKQWHYNTNLLRLTLR